MFASIRTFIMNLVHWFNKQLDWAKSFFEEVMPDGSRKASQKRLVSFLIVATFLYTYGYVLIKKLESISKISDITFPDIPMNWVFLIGYIIGANIFSNMQSAKAVTDLKKVDNSTSGA